MEFKEIMKLVDAGFSKEEILQLRAVESQTPEQTPQTPEQTPEQKPQTPEQTPQTPEQTPQNDFNALISELTNLKKTIQSAAIMNTQMPQQTQETADDVLASIIEPNPPKR